MTMERMAYTGILALLAVVVAVFFIFVANVDQSFPTIALGWLIAAVSLQMGKIIRHH